MIENNFTSDGQIADSISELCAMKEYLGGNFKIGF